MEQQQRSVTFLRKRSLNIGGFNELAVIGLLRESLLSRGRAGTLEERRDFDQKKK